eukprot:TRINITY_DN5044_c0_g1_i4.p3 TRINITY_DN5044_c0_g1~~TRINITY_DN5044_c0_g1_i4.p3  ORF type:complete len:189 (-),score=-0.03 TRINITY_DN5044_c0_g1_i4:119-685(-)
MYNIQVLYKSCFLYINNQDLICIYFLVWLCWNVEVDSIATKLILLRVKSTRRIFQHLKMCTFYNFSIQGFLYELQKLQFVVEFFMYVDFLTGMQKQITLLQSDVVELYLVFLLNFQHVRMCIFQLYQLMQYDKVAVIELSSLKWLISVVQNVTITFKGVCVAEIRGDFLFLFCECTDVCLAKCVIQIF